MSKSMILFAGPCAIENYDICSEVAETIKLICYRLGIDYVFKASFEKANRTSHSSYVGSSMERGLEILKRVKKNSCVKIITDVHESYQCEEVAKIADILQIPAFLCRQTNLIKSAAKTGNQINIKKGQFMAAEDMKFAVEKVKNEGNNNIYLTERGTFFGYHDLVVDMRSISIMRKFAPVIFDVTHSVQQPGANNGKSGGQRQFTKHLARAAAGVGVDGFFIETHPNPAKALSDQDSMISLNEMDTFINMIHEIWLKTVKYGE